MGESRKQFHRLCPFERECRIELGGILKSVLPGAPCARDQYPRSLGIDGLICQSRTVTFFGFVDITQFGFSLFTLFANSLCLCCGGGVITLARTLCLRKLDLIDEADRNSARRIVQAMVSSVISLCAHNQTAAVQPVSALGPILLVSSAAIAVQT